MLVQAYVLTVTIVNTDLSSSLFISFYVHCFSPTLGILRKLKFYLPSYFGITRKMIFGVFPAFYGQRLIAEALTNPSPWSIKRSFVRKTQIINLNHSRRLGQDPLNELLPSLISQLRLAALDCNQALSSSMLLYYLYTCALM